MTNREGVCQFTNVPLDVYDVVVEENREFKESVKTVNTFSEFHQNFNYNLFVGAVSKEVSTVNIRLVDQKSK